MTYQEKRNAFVAYNAGKMSDAELATCLAMLKDLNDTFRAMDERGYHLHGFRLLEISLESMSRARKREPHS